MFYSCHLLLPNSRVSRFLVLVPLLLCEAPLFEFFHVVIRLVSVTSSNRCSPDRAEIIVLISLKA